MKKLAVGKSNRDGGSLSTVLVTGAAGFIGWKVVKKLCSQGIRVIGIDNLNDYYDVSLKKWRLSDLQVSCNNFDFLKLDIENNDKLKDVFEENGFDAVINLAARAGVRASIQNPQPYVTTNILGALNLLELCKKRGVKKFILASTSSLYAGKELPFSEDISTATPISPYAATKGGAEKLAYSYHYLHDMDVSVLRYFTVYGPAGRPDMSPFKFVYWALTNKPIILNGDGTQSRDFTYVDDIAEGTIKALKRVGYEIINLGSNAPYTLNAFVQILEKIVGHKLEIKNKSFVRGDMMSTWANIDKAKKLLGWTPKINFEEGINRTVDWMKNNMDVVKNCVEKPK